MLKKIFKRCKKHNVKVGMKIIIASIIAVTLMVVMFFWQNTIVDGAVGLFVKQSDQNTKSFMEYVYGRRLSTASVAPENFKTIATFAGIISPCKEDETLQCGFDIYLLVKDDYENKKEDQPFYLADKKDGEMIYYGPFNDNVERLIVQASGAVKKFRRSL
jgi:hypothetical protein